MQQKRRNNRGFSLIEVAIATAVIGVGMAAVLVGLGAGTKANDAGQKLTQATFLAGEVREWTCRVPFTSVVSATYSPPHDATGAALTDMPGWTRARSWPA